MWQIPRNCATSTWVPSYRRETSRLPSPPNGKSPTIAKRLKQVLQESIPDTLDEVLHKLQAIRDKLKGDFSEKVKQLNEITEVLVQEKNKT